MVGTRQVFFVNRDDRGAGVGVPADHFLPSQAGRLFREFGFVLSVAVPILLRRAIAGPTGSQVRPRSGNEGQIG